MRLAFVALSLACVLLASTDAVAAAEPELLSVAVLDFGEAEMGQRAADRVAKGLGVAEMPGTKISVLDREQARAAARGIGYRGSLNMTRVEARDLGAAIGCDFYITGEAQIVRRSSSDVPAYYEAYASIFVVSARTGRLAMWERPSAEAPTPEQAEKSLLAELDDRKRTARYILAMRRAREDDRIARELAARSEPAEIEDLTEDGSEARVNLRSPQPYRRLQPQYPETAARAEAEATIVVLVVIDAEGEVGRVEVVRWGGFGLDEAVVDTVRRLHFRPATRDGVPVPARVLLRYNFRRPSKAGA